jgi:hypothetical protein
MNSNDKTEMPDLGTDLDESESDDDSEGGFPLESYEL